jgi:hypothetical protein
MMDAQVQSCRSKQPPLQVSWDVPPAKELAYIFGHVYACALFYCVVLTLCVACTCPCRVKAYMHG